MKSFHYYSGVRKFAHKIDIKSLKYACKALIATHYESLLHSKVNPCRATSDSLNVKNFDKNKTKLQPFARFLT